MSKQFEKYTKAELLIVVDSLIGLISDYERERREKAKETIDSQAKPFVIELVGRLK